MSRLYVSLTVLFACGCSTAEPVLPPEVEPEIPASIAEAKALYPKLLDLHAGPIQKSCSPNPGVCHNSNNFPDLQTPGTLLALINERCNLDLPDPSQGWDACERAPDFIRAGAFESDIAFVESIGPGRWRMHFRQAPLLSGRVGFSIWSADNDLIMQPIAEWLVSVDLRQGETSAETDIGIADTQPFVVTLVDEVFAALVGGDPNRNGVFGADDQDNFFGAEIVPGSLEQSYLWGRLTGTVPGTRMPLANAPLTNAEYAALACWIEGLATVDTPAVDQEIDYDNCAYAQAPLDPAGP